jgi:hypothetical protein
MYLFSIGLRDPVRLTGKNEIVYGLWNITAGNNSTLATDNNYDIEKSLEQAFDSNYNIEYTCFDASR